MAVRSGAALHLKFNSNIIYATARCNNDDARWIKKLTKPIRQAKEIHQVFE